jgi:starch phosphorylase
MLRAIGDGREHGEDPALDAIEANALYSLLEHEIAPEFYQRDSAGIPTKWVARMRESMARLTPEYSANHAVREYTETHYTGAANAHLSRANEQGKLAGEILTWQQKVAAGWSGVPFGLLKAESNAGLLQLEIPVHLSGLDPETVRVELYASSQNGEDAIRQPMNRRAELAGNGFLYSATLKTDRGANDFTPRAVPYNPSASVPLETSQILWQK